MARVNDNYLKLKSSYLFTYIAARIKAFQAEHPELTLSEISRRSGLPLTTTHRLVRELSAWGALERGADGRYHIGLHLWEIAALGGPPRRVAPVWPPRPRWPRRR